MVKLWDNFFCEYFLNEHSTHDHLNGIVLIPVHKIIVVDNDTFPEYFNTHY